ncbi:hypothetical protein QYF61_009110 [Mycteria americana]|uniref:Uncharacterized protein n=1 Tax=Mycteria americana TaxID=33587 RepID=A0AAN7RS97_MYCAM|nr:hypothetical protein QYF61_009110 [Mycteria americana]
MVSRAAENIGASRLLCPEALGMRSLRELVPTVASSPRRGATLCPGYPRPIWWAISNNGLNFFYSQNLRKLQAVQWDLHRLEERGSTNLKKFSTDKCPALYQGWSNTMHQRRLGTDKPWAV